MPNTISSQGFEYGVKHFYNPKSGLILDILKEFLNLSIEEATFLLNFGAVYIEHQRQNKNIFINENSLFRVHTKPRRYNVIYDWKSRVIYECSDFIVLNKPSGVPSHPSVDNSIENSLSQLELAIDKKLLITHRLDTLTSGLIVYAKSKEFVKSFNSQLQDKLIEKKYEALVETSKPLPPKLIHYMKPSPRAPKELSVHLQENWLLCELDVLEQKQLSLDTRWIKINLLTGRTHQIRAQMSALDCPIQGDTLYGAKSSFEDGSIALTAVEISFNWENQRHLFQLDDRFQDR